MPHNGPRGSPLTERRNAVVPAVNIAAETMLPTGIVTETPLTITVTVSGMLCHPCGKVRRDWNGRLTIHDLGQQEFRCAE